MKKIILAAFLIFALGCVEVRDKNTEESNPAIGILSVEGNQIIDEELFVHEGRLLNHNDYKSELEHQTRWAQRDYTFSFKQLTLKPRGRIYTMGHNVRFVVEDLSVEGGLLATFPDQKATVNKDGRSGAHLVLSAQKAQGHLYVHMRGENGAAGQDGAPPITNSGQPGKPGGNGFNGGSSGTFVLEVQLPNRFSFNVDRAFGVGGKAGKGGKGEKGDSGIAISPSGNPVTSYYRAAKGPDGQPGKDGVVQDMCIEISKVRTCS